jgi:hypothetical protein
MRGASAPGETRKASRKETSVSRWTAEPDRAGSPVMKRRTQRELASGADRTGQRGGFASNPAGAGETMKPRLRQNAGPSERDGDVEFRRREKVRAAFGPTPLTQREPPGLRPRRDPEADGGSGCTNLSKTRGDRRSRRIEPPAQRDAAPAGVARSWDSGGWWRHQPPLRSERFFATSGRAAAAWQSLLEAPPSQPILSA